MRLDFLFEADGSTRRDFLKSAGALVASSALPVGLAPETVKAVKSLGGVLNCYASGFGTAFDSSYMWGDHSLDERLDQLSKQWELLRHSSIDGVKYHNCGHDINNDFEQYNEFALSSKVDFNKLMQLVFKTGYKIKDGRDDLRNNLNDAKEYLDGIDHMNGSEDYKSRMIEMCKDDINECTEKLNDPNWVDILIYNDNDENDYLRITTSFNDIINNTIKRSTSYYTNNPFKMWWKQCGSMIDWSKHKIDNNTKKLFGDEIKKSIKSQQSSDYEPDENISRWADEGGQNLKLGESFTSKLNNILG